MVYIFVMQKTTLRKGAKTLQLTGNKTVSNSSVKASVKSKAVKSAPNSKNSGAQVIEKVRIDDICIDDSPKTRVFFNIYKIREYASLLQNNIKLPLPVLIKDEGGKLLVGDGFYRIKAQMKLGRKIIEAVVRQGDKDSAFLFSIEANKAHGVPFTREEKRLHIIRLLENPKWRNWSDRAIARICDVSHKTVGNEREQLAKKNKKLTSTVRTFVKNGQTRQMNTSGINQGRKIPSQIKPPDEGAILKRAIEINQKRQHPVKSGDRFLIKSKNSPGYHIVACGDSTELKCLSDLFGDKKADLYVTDPPYNAEIQSNRTCPTKESAEHIANNKMSEKKFGEFLDKAFSAGRKFLNDKAVYYVWAAFPYLTLKMTMLEKLLGIVRQPLIWNKKRFVRHPFYNYSWGHEMCLYGWLPKDKHAWLAETSYTTMFEGKAYEDTIYDIKAKHHPCPKPVEITKIFIENSLRPGKIVYDGFLGSGTTLIAAELAGRLCYGVELLPEYLAVVLDAVESEPLNLKVIPVPPGISTHDFLKSLPDEDDLDMGLLP